MIESIKFEPVLNEMHEIFKHLETLDRLFDELKDIDSDVLFDAIGSEMHRYQRLLLDYIKDEYKIKKR